jgi:hypothetical protein
VDTTRRTVEERLASVRCRSVAGHLSVDPLRTTLVVAAQLPLRRLREQPVVLKQNTKSPVGMGFDSSPRNRRVTWSSLTILPNSSRHEEVSASSPNKRNASS